MPYQQQELNLHHRPIGRPSDRRQIDIDMEMDERLAAGEVLTQSEIDQISDHHLQLLKHCGLKRRPQGWRMPREY